MRQITHRLNNVEEAYGLIKAMVDEQFYINAHSILVQVYTSIIEPRTVNKLIGILCEAMPKVKITGITTRGEISNGAKAEDSIVLSFCFFDKSDVFVEEYDCSVVDIEDVGVEIVERLTRISNVVGIQIYGTTSKIAIDNLISTIIEHNSNIPIFGAGAGTLNYQQQDMLVFGKKCYTKGVVIAIFAGPFLDIQIDYNLGWIPIGKEMEITEVKNKLCVEMIDDTPAVQIYKKYLDVRPNEYFVDNICEFPITINRNGLVIARTPINYDEDGSLYFSSDIHKGEKIRLSYGNAKNIMEEIKKSSEGMGKFEAEALFICACVNRTAFLKEEELLEIEYYHKVVPSVAGGYMYAEIYRSMKGGGVLNSALVAIGLREGEKTHLEKDNENFIMQLENEHNEDIIPFSERLVVFLEAITSELVATNTKLEELATIDYLTKIYNRRRIEQIFNYEIAKCNHPGHLSVIIFDIDNFKKINDSYGHDKGDMVLKEVVGCVKKGIRVQDSFGRWGGEEFLCILPDTTTEEAFIIANRFCRIVSEHDFNELGAVTISAGVTTTVCGDTKDIVFKRTDQALFDAKESGKNRACIR